MATLTIKNIPLEVYERPKRRTKANRRSINQEAIAVIERARNLNLVPKPQSWDNSEMPVIG